VNVIVRKAEVIARRIYTRCTVISEEEDEFKGKERTAITV